MPTPDRPAVGIRRMPHGWQAYIRIDGALRTKHFPPQTDLADLKQWRAEQQARKVLNLEAPPDGETFARDCARYLKAVAGMRTFQDRQYRIEQWRDALGPNRPRSTISSVQIRQQLEQWRTRSATPLKPGSLNLRRTALMHLWTVLDGKSAVNPVKDVPRYRETPPALHLPTIADAEKAIACVRADRKTSDSRARLRVLLWTGWPAAQLVQIKRADLKLSEGIALVRGRRKGSGTRDRWLPLLPQAVAALREFQKLRAFGPFSNSSLHSSLHRGCKAAGVTPFRVYDLRHLFLTTVALAAKDDRVVAELAMHSDVRMVRRYTEASVNPRLKSALAAVGKSLKPPKALHDQVAGATSKGERRGLRVIRRRA